MEYITEPATIERRSMQLISPYLEKYGLPLAEEKLYSRIIHASGDVDYAPIIRIKKVVASGLAALRKRKNIFNDVEMVRTGINKKRLAQYGGQVHCLIANAPTALFQLIEMMEIKQIRPTLIIGVLVGFVGGKESKKKLVDLSPGPYITVDGNKGGSPIAAAIVNALLYMLERSRPWKQ